MDEAIKAGNILRNAKARVVRFIPLDRIGYLNSQMLRGFRAPQGEESCTFVSDLFYKVYTALPQNEHWADFIWALQWLNQYIVEFTNWFDSYEHVGFPLGSLR